MRRPLVNPRIERAAGVAVCRSGRPLVRSALTAAIHSQRHGEPDDRQNVDLIAGFNARLYELIDKFTLRHAPRHGWGWVCADCDFCGCDLRLSFGREGYILECVRDGCGFYRLPERWELAAMKADCA